jgi:zinc-binding dehydrogenase
VHGAAGAVGSMVTQLAREAGAYVIGTGRGADRQTVLDFGAKEFVDLENDVLEDVGRVDLLFDVIGGDIGKRSAGLIRAGGTLVSIVGPPEARPADGLAVDGTDWLVASAARKAGGASRTRDGAPRGISLMAYDEQLAVRIRELLRGRIDVTERKMFGGCRSCTRDRISWGIVGADLVVRVADNEFGGGNGTTGCPPDGFHGQAVEGLCLRFAARDRESVGAASLARMR